MGRPLDVAPLDFVGGGRGEHVHRKGDFEQHVALPPLDDGLEVEARAVTGERDALGVVAVQDAARDLQRRPQGAVFDDAHRAGRVGEPHLVLEEDVHVPGVGVEGPVLESLELVGDTVGREHLPPGPFVVETGDVAGRVQFHAQEVVFQAGEGLPTGYAQRGLRRLRRGGGCRRRQGGDAVGGQFAHVEQDAAHYPLAETAGETRAVGPEGGVAAREGGGVDHQDGGGVVGPLRWPRDGRQGRVPHPRGAVVERTVSAERVRVDRADAAAGQDVVKLVQAEQFPGVAQVVAANVGAGQRPGQRGQKLGVVEEELAPAVGPFDAGLGGVGAAMVFEVQFAVPGGEAVAGGLFQAAEEVVHAPQADTRQRGEGFHLPQVLDHRAGGAAAAVAVAVDEEQRRRRARRPGVFGLELAPRAEHLGGGPVAVVGAAVRAAVGGRAEVGQYPRAVQSLPPEGVVGEAVVLVPAQLGGVEVLQPGLAEQLGQAPGVAEGVRQPQHRRDGGVEVTAEEVAPQEELPRQRLRAGDVAVHLDPGRAEQFPAALPRPLPNTVEQGGGVPAHEFVQLGLALPEVERGELRQQVEGVAEGVDRLAAGAGDRPQPGHVQVGVADGDDFHSQRRAGPLYPFPQEAGGDGDAFVEAVADGLADVQQFEGRVEGGVEVRPRRMVVGQRVGGSQGDAGQGEEVARGAVNLHQGALAQHQPPGDGVTGPAAQFEGVLRAVGAGRRQGDLLVMTVAGGQRPAVEVDRRLRVAEVPLHAQREVQGERVAVPGGRDAEADGEGELLIGAGPAVAGGERPSVGGGEGGQRPATTVDQRREQPQTVRDLRRRPADGVERGAAVVHASVEAHGSPVKSSRRSPGRRSGATPA